MRQTDILLGLMLAGLAALGFMLEHYEITILLGLSIPVLVGHHIIVAIRELRGEVERTPDLLDPKWRDETEEIVRNESAAREKQL